MKKFTVSVLGLAMAASGLTAPVAAQSDNAAVVINDIGCVAFIPDENGNPTGFVVSPDAAHVVATKSGNRKVTCQFDIPAGQEPARATQAQGFACGVFDSLTFDSRIIASPGGRLTLICHVNGKD